jgi:hypothetical protein
MKNPNGPAVKREAEEDWGRFERSRDVGKWRRGSRGPRLRSRVPPLSQSQLNAFSPQKHLSEPLMIIEPEISL